MCKLFPNENFYTKDFDQQMLDFIKGKYAVFKAGKGGHWRTSYKYLKYNTSNNYFWTSDIKDDDHYVELTKTKMKEKIGMTNKTFSKKDLVAGKHVIECGNKNKYLVTIREDGQLFGINLNRDSFLPLNCHDSNLEYNSKDLSVNVVYEMNNYSNFLDLTTNLKIIWKREERSETQIQFEKLQQQIEELQIQANKLKDTL